MSTGLLAAKDRPRFPKALFAFGMPPVAITASGILMRVAIHNSMWGAVPVFFLVLVLGSVSCFILAIWYAREGTRTHAVPRFIGWILASALFVWGGLALIGLIPMTVGDGP